jgi:gluconate 2-dehydrogenase gamma chain
MDRRTLLQLLDAAPLAASAQEAPRSFSPGEYRTLRLLCEYIIPADATSGGAVEAHVPELIDLLASENDDYQRRIAGGIQWLDAECQDRFGSTFFVCSPQSQKSILDLIAYRENADRILSLTQGIAFFDFLRELTLGGYFTSQIGIQYLPYLGNQVLPGFPGCPVLPDS